MERYDDLGPGEERRFDYTIMQPPPWQEETDFLMFCGTKVEFERRLAELRAEGWGEIVGDVMVSPLTARTTEVMRDQRESWYGRN